jgi:nucleoside-diphosphate-sugar epimerase
MTRRVVVAGALGVVGRSTLDHFERQTDCEVIALSRRAPDFETRARFIAVDLSDPQDCRAKLVGLRATHIVYCALFGRTSANATWGDQDQIMGNLRMLENCLDAVENPDLAHVAVLQGAKAYGCHLGHVPLPGKEEAPRHPHPNFYWQQEDLIRDRGRKGGWSWTVFRPQYIVGFSIGSPINILSPIGVYAAVSRQLGLPLAYTGRTGTPTEATDARLLAKAIDWSQTAATARNEIFNITNGDVFTFPSVFRSVAGCFGLDVGMNQCGSLQILMSDKEALWADIVRRRRLRPYTLLDLVGPSWVFADAAFSSPEPFFESTIKIRKAGFADCIDSNQMFVEWIEDLQERRILPT